MNDPDKEKMKAAFRSDLRKRWKQQLKEMEEEEIPKPKSKAWPQWAIAASLLLGLGLSLWAYWPGEKNTTSANLYTEYFEAPPNILKAVTRNQSKLSTLDSALLYYEAGRYENAILVFNSIENQKEDLLFYRGISYMEVGAFDKAMEDLSGIQDARFSKEAQWFVALLQLQLGNTKNSKEILDLILNDPGHPYTDKARLLKKNL